MKRRREGMPSPEKVRRELGQAKDKASAFGAMCDRLVEKYEEAYEAGLTSAGHGMVMTHGGGFARGDDTDPTGDIVISRDHQRIRRAVRNVGSDIGRALKALDDAEQEFMDAFLDTDPDLKADRAANRRAAAGGA